MPEINVTAEAVPLKASRHGLLHRREVVVSAPSISPAETTRRRAWPGSPDHRRGATLKINALETETSKVGTKSWYLRNLKCSTRASWTSKSCKMWTPSRITISITIKSVAIGVHWMEIKRKFSKFYRMIYQLIRMVGKTLEQKVLRKRRVLKTWI